MNHTKKNKDIDRTVVSVELVETIIQKLGITSSIEELVKSYNMTLPIGFPVFLLNTKPLFKSEDRNKYPECARKVFFPWRDILACIVVKHHHLALSERTCPDCGERMVLSTMRTSIICSIRLWNMINNLGKR